MNGNPQNYSPHHDAVAHLSEVPPALDPRESMLAVRLFKMRAMDPATTTTGLYQLFGTIRVNAYLL